jgi:hypothetical protein
LLASFANAVVAASPDQSEAPIVVLESDVRVVNPTSSGGGAATVLGGVAIAGGEAEASPGGQRYWIKARNVGSKKIVAAEYAFDFFTPFGELYATEYVQWASDWKVWKPKHALDAVINGKPVDHAQDRWHHKVRVVRVKFEDGTTWTAPTTAKPEP